MFIRSDNVQAINDKGLTCHRTDGIKGNGIVPKDILTIYWREVSEGIIDRKEILNVQIYVVIRVHSIKDGV